MWQDVLRHLCPAAQILGAPLPALREVPQLLGHVSREEQVKGNIASAPAPAVAEATSAAEPEQAV